MSRQARLVTTRAGVTIGIAFVPRRELREVTRSEEQVQTALLAKPRRIDWPAILFAVVAVVSFSALLAWSH
jgi:hypothetical protein